jgi:hypothetical protein
LYVRKIVWFGPVVGVAVVSSFVVGSVRSVAGQDVSPTSAAVGGVSCTTEPKPVDELIPLWFTPDGSPAATPVGSQPFESEADLPQGTPADEATVAAINATIQEIFACFDAGQYARGFALMTDHAISQFGPDVTNPDEDTPAEVRALLERQIAGTPVAGEISEEPTVISEARDARVLSDGRVGAIFESQGDQVFAIFVKSGDRWLLDDFIDIIEQGTPTA